MPRLFVIGAPSGTGKTTLLRRLLESVPALRFSVSHTTRAARPGEQDGRDYHFVTSETFAREVEAGRFLEWAEVYGQRYGTHRAELERAEAEGVELLLDIDVQGARSVRELLPGAVQILILPPSWEALEARLRGRRTESGQALARRLADARAQVAGHHLYDYAVVNEDLEAAAGTLASIVRAERARIAAARPLIARLLGEGAA